jgi:hypothetical protein
MRYIALSNKTRATICDCHYDLVSDYKWRNHRGYVVTNIDGKYKGMHALIANTPIGSETDHINRNTKDNRCCNLRVVTVSENQMNRGPSIKNTSGYKGVYWRKNINKWAARVEKNNKKYTAGVYTDKEQAAIAYDCAAIQLFGDVAYTNIL